MSENPTYRISGEDWDPISPGARAGREPEADAERARTRAGGGQGPAPATAASPSRAPGAPPAQPPGGAPAHGPSGTAPGAPIDAAPGAPSGSSLAGPARRLPRPLGMALGRIPPRLLLAGAGLGVAAVAIVFLVSGRPGGVAATATVGPSVVAPVATLGCGELVAPLPIPELVVTERDGDQLRLDGFAPAAGATLDGPWPAALGSVEATVPLGSTLHLAVTGACIGEWRAVAAHPPETPGSPWRPDTPETQQLGWQSAERIAWQPSVPLPPRGEWIVRVTLWFRGPAASAAAATVAPDLSPAGSPSTAWVVERYYRLVVEAPGS